MKENEIVLPEGWELKTIGDACGVIMGQSPPSESYNTDKIGLPFFQGKAEFSEMYPVVSKWCSTPGKVAEMNDVLLSVRAPVGATNIANQKCCIGRGLAAIRFKNYKYLFYFLKSIQQELDSKGTGTTFRAISGETLRSTKIPLPPIAEQHRIVSKIEELFSELEKGKEQILLAQQQLKTYRQAVLKWAFEGLNNLASLAEVAQDTSIGLVRSNAQLVEEGKGVPYLRMNNVDMNGNVQLENLVRIDCDNSELARFGLREGDILINTRNSFELVGKAGIVRAITTPTVFNNNLMRIRCKSEFDSRFLLYQIISPMVRKQMLTEKKATTNVCALYQRDIMPLQIKVTDILTQHRIVQEIESRLSVCDAMEATLQTSLAQAEVLRQSILKRAFEGRLG